MTMTFKAFLVKTREILSKKDDINPFALPESFLDPKRHEADQSKSRDQRYDNGLTFSTTWSLGGSHGDYTGEKRTVEPDNEPEDIPHLDYILEGLAPNVTFLQYRGLVREVMERGQRYHGDYYGGSTTEAYKGFSIKTLYDALVSRGIV